MDEFMNNNIVPDNENTGEPKNILTDENPQEKPTQEFPVQETIIQPPVDEPINPQPTINPVFVPAYTNTPYGTTYTQIPSQGQPVYRENKPKNKKKNTGKIVFIAIICLCIVFGSVAVGFGLSDLENQNNNSQNSQNNVEFGADAVIEDSPVSYSKYSGKGTMTPEQVYQAVKDINVGILVYSQNKKVGEGSGIVVGESKDKKSTYIITAAHVIKDGGSVQVQFIDESEVEATIVGLDEKTDIGVLRINKTGYAKATFGNSSKLSVGQKVYAIGNPGGTEFFGSFTSGIISAIDRPVPTTTSSYDLPCIQHNAAINPGNSGGALVNEYGQVIGLNSSKISSTEYEGMGFSVPSETILEVYNEIIKNGYVSNRPMLGITDFPVSSDYNYSAIAWKSGLPYGSIVIASISDSSDISKRGIKEGDIITAVNGKELETTDILLEAIEKAKVGDKLELTICRISNTGTVSKTFDATVTLVEDKGDNKVPETPVETTDPFSNYFDNFGY